MVRLKRKVKGSTLLEVLVAMVIIIICLGMATIIILNISKSGSTQLKLLAEQYAEKVIEQSKLDHEYGEESYETENIIIEKRVKAYKNMEGLIELSVTVYNSNMKQLIQTKELVIIE